MAFQPSVSWVCCWLTEVSAVFWAWIEQKLLFPWQFSKRKINCTCTLVLRAPATLRAFAFRSQSHHAHALSSAAKIPLTQIDMLLCVVEWWLMSVLACGKQINFLEIWNGAISPFFPSDGWKNALMLHVAFSRGRRNEVRQRRNRKRKRKEEGTLGEKQRKFWKKEPHARFEPVMAAPSHNESHGW